MQWKSCGISLFFVKIPKKFKITRGLQVY